MDKDNDMSAMLLKYFPRFLSWKHYHKISRAAKCGPIKGAIALEDPG